MLVYVPFFKVIVISVDIFESSIIDERHFSSRTEAESFANKYKCLGVGISYYCPDVTMQYIHTNSRHYILVGAALFRGSICATKYNLKCVPTYGIISMKGRCTICH